MLQNFSEYMEAFNHVILETNLYYHHIVRVETSLGNINYGFASELKASRQSESDFKTDVLIKQFKDSDLFTDEEKLISAVFHFMRKTNEAMLINVSVPKYKANASCKAIVVEGK